MDCLGNGQPLEAADRSFYLAREALLRLDLLFYLRAQANLARYIIP